MTTRQVALVAIVSVLALIGIIAVIQPELPERGIHWLHLAGLILGALDVLLVVVSFLATTPESH